MKNIKNIEIIENLLMENLNIDLIEGQINELIANSNETSYNIPILRLFNAYKAKKIVDLCGNLRQCLIYYKNRVAISEKMYKKILKYEKRFCFYFEGSKGQRYINVDNKIMRTIPELSSRYEFVKRRTNNTTISDGRMYRYYKYKTYISIAQKLLNYFIANCKNKETILACLPTGGGKSLAWQLPAISKMYNGTIIVVVPTVALAMDHEKTSKEFFHNIFGEECYPKAYTSDLNRTEKDNILKELKEGRLPVLYISPEALLRKEFKKTVLEAAKEGEISTLIVDEVHIVVNWGMNFRTEFQLLPLFKKQLEQICNIKTILLSATLTDEDTDIIKNIFGEDDLIEFRADQLRPEPEYYLYESKFKFKKKYEEKYDQDDQDDQDEKDEQDEQDEEKIKIITELVDEVPRPLILYVMTPKQGEDYLEILKKRGYKNIQTFSGKTTNNKRKNIIEDWNNNKIDIMIATSAFGMGVDKSDVRTIITGYVPESISRFYQEVGRAGRDGFSTLNYFVFNKGPDFRLAQRMKAKLITAKNLTKRWKKLRSQAKRINPDEIEIDLDELPENLEFKSSSSTNASWNKAAILMLYRANLIEIIDCEIKSERDFKMQIKLKRIDILENMNKLEIAVDNHRNIEKEMIDREFENVKNLLNVKECYSKHFQEEYPYASGLCNGCPFCRKKNLEKFASESYITIKSTKGMAFENDINEEYHTDKFGLRTNNSVLISYEDKLDVDKCIEYLVKEGVNIIITEKVNETVLNRLKYYEQYKYMILTLDEANEVGLKWLRGTCALIYPEDHFNIQNYYSYGKKYMQAHNSNNILHISKYRNYIDCESKEINELVDKSLMVNVLYEEETDY